MDEYWATFVAVLGKERAVDYLIILMRTGFETLEQIVKGKSHLGNQKRSRSNEVGEEDATLP